MSGRTMKTIELPIGEGQDEVTSPQPHTWERLLCSGLVMIVGVVILVGSFDLGSGPGYQSVGPEIFPRIIGVGASICGVLLIASDLRSIVHTRRHEPNAATGSLPSPTRWKSVMALAGALTTYAFLIGPVGFWQSSGLLFVCAARIFGSKRWFRNALIGFGLALAAYLLFDRVLEVQLPGGYIRIPG
jgi:putative tricarboxylic transport membrane protein